MVNIQYPHTLQKKNENGHFVDHTICRDQPNDKGKDVFIDGSNYKFSSLIFVPVSTTGLLVGQDIIIIGERSEKRLKATIKRISHDSFHIRIWV